VDEGRASSAQHSATTSGETGGKAPALTRHVTMGSREATGPRTLVDVGDNVEFKVSFPSTNKRKRKTVTTRLQRVRKDVWQQGDVHVNKLQPGTLLMIIKKDSVLVGKAVVIKPSGVVHYELVGEMDGSVFAPCDFPSNGTCRAKDLVCAGFTIVDNQLDSLALGALAQLQPRVEVIFQ